MDSAKKLSSSASARSRPAKSRRIASSAMPTNSSASALPPTMTDCVIVRCAPRRLRARSAAGSRRLHLLRERRGPAPAGCAPGAAVLCVRRRCTASMPRPGAVPAISALCRRRPRTRLDQRLDARQLRGIAADRVAQLLHQSVDPAGGARVIGGERFFSGDQVGALRGLGLPGGRHQLVDIASSPACERVTSSEFSVRRTTDR